MDAGQHRSNQSVRITAGVRQRPEASEQSKQCEKQADAPEDDAHAVNYESDFPHGDSRSNCSLGIRLGLRSH